VSKLGGKSATILIAAAGGTHIYHRYLILQQVYGYKNNLAISFTESYSVTIPR